MEFLLDLATAFALPAPAILVGFNFGKDSGRKETRKFYERFFSEKPSL